MQFHLYDMLEYAKLTYGDRNQIHGCFWGRKLTEKWHKEISRGDGNILCPGWLQ